MDNATVIVEEMNITFICESTGFPLPTIVWSRTNGALSNRVFVSDSVTALIGNGNVTKVSVNLTITNISREDAGVYVCQATNSIDSDSSNISVTVQCKYIVLYNCTIVH